MDLLGTVKRLDEALTNALGRIAELERDAATRGDIDARRSSIEVGTPAKGGSIKCYFDPFGDKQVNEDAVNEAKRLLALAGGVPLPPSEVKQ